MTDRAKNTKDDHWYRRHRLRLLLVLLAGMVIAMAVNYPLPYYVTRPGSAVELGAMIEVEGGEKNREGAFMLTTVRMGQATPFWYLYAQLSPSAELIEQEKFLLPGETGEEFTQRELLAMENSQLLASAVAFRLAGHDVTIENRGVEVVRITENSPAKHVLKPGDVIVRLNETEIRTMQELLNYLSTRNPGERVEVTYLRGQTEETRQLTLIDLAAGTEEAGRAGLGISVSNHQKIEVPKKVTVSSRNIGGPSAGLMMTLEIYDQLTKELNLTRGYRIAGTGEILFDGSVGRIGGVNHKVIAADTAGADIFFAPADEEAEGRSNYQEALDTARRIGTDMRVVPVKTVQDAIDYLTKLEPKSS